MHAPNSGVGVVAVFAKMAEDNVVKVVVRDGFHEFSNLIVREMPVPGADALLRRPRTFCIRLEQVGIVIGFDKKGVRSLEAILDESRDEADVAENAQLGFDVLNDKSNGIHGIVRDWKTLDAKILEIEGAAGLHQLPPRFAFGIQALHDRFLSEGGAEQGNGVFSANDIDPTGVIAVLVAQENAMNRVNAHARGFQARNDLLGAKACIDQDRGVLGGNDGTIAGAAAAEDGET